MLLIILLLFMSRGLANQMFAGNGLTTYSHTILHNRIMEMNCTTYDDCYELLCDFLAEPVFIVQIKPLQWNGYCNNLNKTDNRLFKADFDAYHNGIYNGTYETNTNSDASMLLCALSKNTNITSIYYSNFGCQLSYKKEKIE